VPRAAAVVEEVEEEEAVAEVEAVEVAIRLPRLPRVVLQSVSIPRWELVPRLLLHPNVWDLLLVRVDAE